MVQMAAILRRAGRCARRITGAAARLASNARREICIGSLHVRSDDVLCHVPTAAFTKTTKATKAAKLRSRNYHVFLCGLCALCGLGGRAVGCSPGTVTIAAGVGHCGL